jgi:hypothetical protein
MIVTPSVPAETQPPVAAVTLFVEPTLQVSRTEGLDPSGDTVTVVGSGFDESRGIYVAFCVVPPPGQPPTPCGGGVDLEGSSGGSRWISSAPPDYGVGLAQPWGPGGSFEVEVDVSAMLRDDIDCRQVQCAIVTRADHTRLADRSLDVVVPVLFAAPPVLTLPPMAQQAVDTAPNVTPDPPAAIEVEALGPPRGAASTWPVWLGTAVAVVGLAAAVPRRRRASDRATDGETS